MRKAFFLFVVVALWAAQPIQAATVDKPGRVQSQPLPPPPQEYQMANQAPVLHYQAPPTLPSGNANLIHYWYEYGGARLYWQGLLDPQQVKLLGTSWRDPAAYPLLTDTGNGGNKGRRSYGKRKVTSAKGAKGENNKKPGTAAQTSKADAPKADVGKADGKAQAGVRTKTRSPHLVPGPKPTTYSEISPKAAISAKRGVSTVTVPVQTTSAAPMAGAIPALAPAAQAPTPLVPASQQLLPAATVNPTAGNSPPNNSRQ